MSSQPDFPNLPQSGRFNLNTKIKSDPIVIY